ncbi:S8 family serine peptidase [Hymenobacter yonginensis]|uniref:S8 family serine peptidase n=1 Tax=Hymenobacter yonginensis TaxID=748197 RepID=A0ABY7PSL2_9BACT|nr:S8 family serine peptidase [Hymenobacter yonginensis]WBO85877.1 S8 family serine peptidase [Hymenobacter yonginensis]
MIELTFLPWRAAVFCAMLSLPWAVPAASAQIAAGPPTAGYWVELRDKAGVSFNPGTYFTAAAQLRRQRQHLPAADSSDFPVRPDYLRSVRQHADSVLLVSRWLNAVACRATPAQAAALAQLPGVRRVLPLAGAEVLPAARPAALQPAANRPISTADRQLARRQTRSLGADALRQAGLDGKGLRIAVFDVGFSGADRHAAFQELFEQKRVVATYDFARRTPDVFHGGGHGTEVLACLAGRLPDGTPLGLATGATYLLARTERMQREIYAEELDWLAAAEWADRNGADIINSSLGYTARRYFPEQMTGRRSLVARAASLAARKGMLVVSAAGNDGDNDDWRTVGTPADADSVLAVGGVDPETGLHLDFSAYGPTADRRLKPNVAAFGTVLTAAPGGSYARVDGTSFSSPLVAGLAACAWQQQRGLTAMQLFGQLQQSSTLYPYYDYAHGYGLPQAARLLRPAASPPPTLDFVVLDSLLAVNIRPEALQPLPLYADSLSPQPEGARRVPAVGREESRPAGSTQAAPPSEAAPVAVPATRYLYWHVADARGVLRRYEVLEVSQRAILRIPRRTLQPGDVVRVYYLGATHSFPVL